MKNEIFYTCEKHGEVGNQVFTIGVFDINRCFKQKTLCGICHFEMLTTACSEAIPLPPKSQEKPTILTRNNSVIVEH